MNILIVCHKGQEGTILPELEKILKKNYSVVDRECLKESDYEKKELAIVIGGDGTFLRANQLNKNVPMIGINPNPHTREGFYCQMNSIDFREKTKKILDGKYDVIELLRLKAEINSKEIKKYILNEVYIGDVKPYNVFNYEIKIKGKKEFQRSSGVIIGTPSGSNAWIKSARGELMLLEEKKFQFVARELYEGKHTKDYKMTKGILNSGESAEIVCKSPGIIVLDSIKPEYAVKIGDTIRVSSAKDDLRYVKLK
jgi:NAD kinase